MGKKLLELHVSKSKSGREHYMFYCPGCDEHHWISSSWTITGTEDKPTVRPSIRARKGCGIMSVCHLFITDGRIQYLDDCTHDLRGVYCRDGGYMDLDEALKLWTMQRG